MVEVDFVFVEASFRSVVFQVDWALVVPTSGVNIVNQHIATYSFQPKNQSFFTIFDEIKFFFEKNETKIQFSGIYIVEGL